MEFGRLGRCTIEANFEGGALSSDGGLMLLRQVDRRLGLSRAVAEALHAFVPIDAPATVFSHCPHRCRACTRTDH